MAFAVAAREAASWFAEWLTKPVIPHIIVVYISNSYGVNANRKNGLLKARLACSSKSLSANVHTVNTTP